MYLPLYCKGSKRFTQGLRVRGSWGPNRTAIFWPTLLWPSALCLSHSPGLLNRRPRGPALCWMMNFFTASYQQLLWTPTQSGAPSPFGLVWLSLLHLVSTPTVWLLVLTELYNSSTPTQSPYYVRNFFFFYLRSYWNLFFYLAFLIIGFHILLISILVLLNRSL